MRIFLLATNTELEPYPVYPLGMAVVAAALHKAGHEVLQYDCLSKPSSKQALQAAVSQFSPDLIGISIRNIDNVDLLTPGSNWALDFIRQIILYLREGSLAPIVLGGSGFSLMPEQILDYCHADYGIVGEAETSFCLLLDELVQGNTPARIIRSKQHLAGAQIEGAHYDASALQYYVEHSGVVGIQTKRGCPKHCLYCSYPQLEGRDIRARDPEAVVDDIIRLQRSIDFKELFFTDSVFNDKDGHWLVLAESILRRGVKLAWTGFFQPEGLDAASLKLCKAAGLKAVELGTDACADATLKAMGKGFDFSVAAHATELCNSLHIPCAHFVIIGGPAESEATLQEGLHNLSLLPNCLVFPFLGVRILPGAPLFQYALDEGVITEHDSCLAPTYYFSPSLQQDTAYDMILNSFKGNRQRIFPPAAGQEKMKILRDFGYKGILWDTLIRFDCSKK